MDFFDFYKVMEQPSKDIPVVFAIPGLLYGVEKSLFEYIDQVRIALKKEEIKVFCHTWEDEHNTPYINNVLEMCQEFPSIKLILKTEPYTTPENINFFKKIISGIGVRVQDPFNLDMSNFKRIIPLLAYHKIYKDIFWFCNSNVKDLQHGHTLVIKLKPNMVPVKEEVVEKKFLFSLQSILQSAQKNITVKEMRSIDHPFDILYCGEAGSSSIGDVFNFTSHNTFHNIFCSTMDELAERIIGFYKTHMEDYPYLLQTEADLLPFGNSPKYLSLEGSTILHYLAVNAKKHVCYLGTGHTLPSVDHYRPIKNPLYKIIDSKVVCIHSGIIENKKLEE